MISHHQLQCVVCGCTEFDACLLADGEPCGWELLDPPVCSNPECVAVAARDLTLVRHGALWLAVGGEEDASECR